jgi:hypothetical protein
MDQQTQIKMDKKDLQEELIQKYLASLTPKQYKAYEIAKDHLGMSFQTEKSNGFLGWVKKNTL